MGTSAAIKSARRAKGKGIVGLLPMRPDLASFFRSFPVSVSWAAPSQFLPDLRLHA
jgi:hypothetical protein